MAPEIVGLGEDSFISRKQFILSYDGENLLLEDANSSNGTFLNNVRINSKVVVTSGNIVRVGKNAGEREFSVLIMQA